jgi:hypothetical protein
MTSRNKVLSCFSSPQRCVAPVPSASTWRWSSTVPALVHAFWCDNILSCRHEAPNAFLLLSCSGGCGDCGWSKSGSSSISPPSRCLSVASSDPG